MRVAVTRTLPSLVLGEETRPVSGSQSIHGGTVVRVVLGVALAGNPDRLAGVKVGSAVEDHRFEGGVGCFGIVARIRGSAAPLEAGLIQRLESIQQTVGVVLESSDLRNPGVQSGTGVGGKGDGVIGVAGVPLSAEVAQAGSAVPTVQQVCRCHRIVLLSGPAGAASGGGGLCQVGDLLGDALALVEQAALLTLQVEQSKPSDIGLPLLIEGEGGGIGSGEGHGGGVSVALVL